MTEPHEYDGFLYAANKDALAIKALSDADIALHCEAICFHCQQSAEKMLKNVFVVNGVRPQKSHDVGDLLSKALSRGWIEATEEEMQAAISLTMFAVVSRYETAPDISEAEAREAMSDCRAISAMLNRNGYQSVDIL